MQAILLALLPAIAPTGPVVVKGSDLYVGETRMRFHGVNLTDTACFPANPQQTAKQLESRGVNWVRLHHIDRLIREKTKTPDQLTDFMDALYAQGIRVSIDLYSKRGETWPSGVDGYKLDLYENRNRARSDLSGYVAMLRPVLKHKSLFLVCLVNEGATVLRNNNSPAGAKTKAAAFYAWGKNVLKSNGYQGLVTDLPDGAVDVSTYGDVAKKFDLCTIHFYGGHPDVAGGKYFTNSWALEGWNWGTSLWYGITSGRPVLVQEWGSLPFNPKRGANSAFIVAETLNAGFDGEAQFAYASNQSFLDGKFDRVDWYNFGTDRPRLVADMFASMAAKYGTGPRTDYYWGHQTPPESAKYRWGTANVKLTIDGSKAQAIVFASPTKAYVFLWDETTIRGFDSQPAGQMRRVTAMGSAIQSAPRSGAIVVKDGYRAVTAYEIDPWTGKRASKSVASGGAFRPTNGCAAYEVSLTRS